MNSIPISITVLPRYERKLTLCNTRNACWTVVMHLPLSLCLSTIFLILVVSNCILLPLFLSLPLSLLVPLRTWLEKVLYVV